MRRRIDELAVAGHAGLTWQRFHNSIPRGRPELAQKTLGTAGSWRSNWQYDLIEETDPKTGRATFELIYPSGIRRVLYLTKSKMLSAPKGLPERGLLRNGGVQVTLADNSSVFFNVRPQANRKPRYEAAHLTKPTGEIFRFSRDSMGRLVQVKNDDGGWIRIGYKTVPLQTNLLVRVGEVVRAPARGKWLELPVALTSASARALSVRLQVPAQAQIAEVEFYAVGSSVPLTGTVYQGLGAAAFDRNAATTYKNANNQDSVMVRFDLPLGSNVRLGKVRLLAVTGTELQLIGTQVKVGLLQSPKRSLAVVSTVKTSNGLALTYEYEKQPWTGGEEQLALTHARYGDGTVANYAYSGKTAKLGSRPLLVLADDPRYTGRAKQIAYEYQAPVADKLKAGVIKAEKHPVTGAVWARLELPTADPQKRIVHYSDDRAITYRVHADGSGRVTERTDSLGRKTTYHYSRRDQGPAYAVRDHQGKVAAYTLNDQGRATAVKRSHEPQRKKPAVVAGKASATKNSQSATVATRSTTTIKKDRDGHKVETMRNARGQVERVRSADGTESRFSHDAKGRLVESSQKGMLFTFGYDKAGRRTSMTDAMRNVTRYAHDSHGYLAQITDPSGRVTRHERDEQGRITKTTHADGRQHTIVRDGYGRVTAETDVEGRKAEYAYDILGRKTRETDFAGRTTVYGYSELPMSCGSCTLSDRPTRIVRADGAVTELLYDSEGRVLAKTAAAGTAFSATTTFTYDTQGRVLAMVGPDNTTTRNTYDRKGRLTTTTDPLGRKTNFTYNMKGQRLSATDAAGRTTRWTYDGRGNATEIVAPTGSSTKNVFDTNHRLTRHTDATGAVTRYNYDAFGNVTQQTDAKGGTTSHTYDTAHRRTETRYADGKRDTWTYDTAGRITQRGTADGRVANLSYDASNRLLSERDTAGRTTGLAYLLSPTRMIRTDPLGRVTTMTYAPGGGIAEVVLPDRSKTSNAYDAAGRTVASTDAAGNTTRYTYTAAGDMASLTDAKGNTYRFGYDLNRRRTAMIYPDGSQEKWSYNAAGQVLTYITRAGQTKTTTYNAGGRPLTETWSPDGSAPNVVYAYDKAGRVITADNAQAKLTYTYDALDRVASETSDLTALVPGLALHTVRYDYDELGRRESLIYPDRTKVSYGYDGRGRMTTVSDGPGRAIAGYDYDQFGRIEKLTRDNGVVTRYAYDVAGQLTDIKHVKGSEVLVSSHYALDACGRPTARIHEDGVTESYDYDSTSQVVGVEYGTALARRESFAYDALGNRIGNMRQTDKSASLAITYSVNSLNQYSQIRTGGVSTSFVYDNNGNLTNDGRQFYRYDARNRLVSVEPTGTPAAGATKIAFFYDARNRCVLRSYSTADGLGRWQANPGDGRALTYDTAWNLLAERRLNGSRFGEYVHGLRTDEILRAELVPAGAGGSEIYYPLPDRVGSTIALTGGNGGVVERMRYDVFGQPSHFNAAYDPIDATTVSFRFLFTGREWLRPLGISDYRNRYYQPSVGRWLTTDPIRFFGGLNIYGYVGNCPTGLTDPFGFGPCSAEELAYGNANADYQSAVAASRTALNAVTSSAITVIKDGVQVAGGAGVAAAGAILTLAPEPTGATKIIGLAGMVTGAGSVLIGGINMLLDAGANDDAFTSFQDALNDVKSKEPGLKAAEDALLACIKRACAVPTP